MTNEPTVGDRVEYAWSDGEASGIERGHLAKILKDGEYLIELDGEVDENGDPVYALVDPDVELQVLPKETP